jgi:hypothetical protein
VKKKPKKARANVTFDDYLNTLDRADQILLKGAAVIDILMIRAIEMTLPVQECFDATRIHVRQRIQLLAAFALLQPNEIPAYEKLFDLRNKVAHEPSFQLAICHIKEFAKTLSEEQFEWLSADSVDHLIGGQYEVQDCINELVNGLFGQLEDLIRRNPKLPFPRVDAYFSPDSPIHEVKLEDLEK